LNFFLKPYAIFRKIELYLTFLDYSELEAKGADVQTNFEEKDKQIETLSDSVTALSDRLAELTHELEILKVPKRQNSS